MPSIMADPLGFGGFVLASSTTSWNSCNTKRPNYIQVLFTPTNLGRTAAMVASFLICHTCPYYLQARLEKGKSRDK